MSNNSTTEVSQNAGTVIAVRGSVVDAHFEKKLPSMYNLLKSGNQIKMEVITLLDARAITRRGDGGSESNDHACPATG